MSQVKERPILFSGAMVRALRAGSKTQTRRMLKIQPTSFESDKKLYWNWSRKVGPEQWHLGKWSNEAAFAEALRQLYPCPYGKVGERLWVRETFCYYFDKSLVYEADPPSEKQQIAAARIGWKPSILMPRAASRLLLEITAVRCERVQAISESDAVAEGVEVPADTILKQAAVLRYKALWTNINGPDRWATNPWVWVVEFKIIQPD